MANSFWKQGAHDGRLHGPSRRLIPAVTLVQNTLPRALPKVKLPALLMARGAREGQHAHHAQDPRGQGEDPAATKAVKRGAKKATKK